MNIGIVGLGLIGGSIAKALRKNTEHVVWGCDSNDSICLQAQVVGAIDDVLQEDKLALCDLVVIAIYPQDAVEFVKKHRHQFKKDGIVMDCCGVKRVVCEPLFALAQECGFNFVGAHPMAGIEFSGFNHSQNSLFDNASMIMVPSPHTDIAITHWVKALLLEIGFTHIQISTPEEHDEVIACTSQMAHIVSSAYVKSPTAAKYKGYSAGSFGDMTRVAKLNPAMWAELFMANSDNLLVEIDGLVARLAAYGDALRAKNRGELEALLEDGNRIKIELTK
ncbi:MAG: prephenate dehydrogenase [Christensenellaceae bacterium]|jgi:prephenate dehydrogenase|nr:prephenate dehydrogenase [Christensenellaceae bacterium]